jgi:preprotein translocase subunit SecG
MNTFKTLFEALTLFVIIVLFMILLQFIGYGIVSNTYDGFYEFSSYTLANWIFQLLWWALTLFLGIVIFFGYLEDNE